MSFRLCQLFLLSCSALEDAGASDRTRPCNSGECQAGEEEDGVVLVQRKGQYIRKTIPVIGFLKTHKTASSTLTAILQRFAQAHGMSMFFPPDFNHFLGWPGSFPGQENEQHPPPKYDLIAHHAVFNSAHWREYLASNPVFSSVVREPSSQAVSAYDYWVRREGNSTSFAQHLEWVEALQSPSQKPIDISKPTAEFLNPQAWDFGWYEWVGFTTYYDRNATMIKRWLTYLDKDFTNVVVMEHFDEGLALLAKTLNVEPREFAYIEQNVHDSSKTVPSENERSKLLQLYSVDRALYDHFKHVFQFGWANVTGSARTHALAQLRNASGTLQAQCEDIETCPVAWVLEDLNYTYYLHKGFHKEFFTKLEYNDYLQDVAQRE